MKRYLVLFAIFITAVFFYPVFAHAERIGYFFSNHPASAPLALMLIGTGLLTAAGLTRRILKR